MTQGSRFAVAGLIVVVVVLAGTAWWLRTARGRDRGTPEAIVPNAVIPSGTGRRVIMIGLDGADWSLLDQYIQQGRMPVLARLVQQGASGTLTTLHPPLSPLIWTTMLTGTSPLEHRILDFLRVNAVSGKREPITSDERQRPAIWNMATRGNKRSATFGFWATYPAEAVNGVVVSDRLFTFLYSESSPPPGVVNPATEEGWARATLDRVEREVNYDALKEMLPWLTEAEYRQASGATDPYSHPVSALRRILVETRIYDSLARESFHRSQPDLLLVYIQGTDSIGHVFAPYAPPRQPSISPQDFDRYHDVPQQFFAGIDRMLGAYAAFAESTGSVLVLVSDHGFKWGDGRPERLSSVANATAARWHTDDGIYLIWGPGVAPSSGHTGRGKVDQVCSTLLSLLGLPPGKGLAGPPLEGAPPAAGETVDYTTGYVPASVVSTGSTATTAADDETVAKLRALGYVGAASGKGRAIGTRTAGSFNNEGLLLKRRGDMAGAREAFEQALVVDPNLASGLWNLSDLLFASGSSLDQSDTLLVRAFANGLPEGTRFVIGRAIGYQRNGQVDRSIKLLTDAAVAKPDEPEVWLFRGRYRMEQRDCRSALTDFQRATRLAPTSAAALASQGVAELCLEDLSSARRSFERSLQLDSNQPNVREYLRSIPSSSAKRGRS